jgi:hypothetical protein
MHEVAGIDWGIDQYEDDYYDARDEEYSSLFQNICVTNSTFCDKINFN